ncbi:nicotinate-nucleotide pyrophosphorylase [carboxylating] [Fictibacillus solisalsi]|uniref:Probable nicotinate-nucleotide pyrophosphorylase [carboxylating] n=1 Tax=Fictibacillus solisalsi TaxID=459525 RepID=A0A1G9WRQ6_9BACL|nr:carboxylating nicotinate-nucleotide diphosphorylase [Fictibacillus solisalsi]SDM87059.1 nicotinate-nucleotide pyrophosphorylase [carboxylating] [Fictibacillus solisalsi]
MNKLKLKKQLQEFLLEDLGEGDVTSGLLFPEAEMTEARLVSKKPGVFSGMDVVIEGYRLLSENCTVLPKVKDGDVISAGQVLAEVKGPAAAVYSGERVILNLVQRMSGISTLTHHAVTALNSSTTKICDTRKTTPGLRMFEKYAVQCGGGYNHRFGLYDGVMIKDNHIERAGGITEAVKKVKKHLGHMVKIEVETETLEQIKEAVSAKADVIMFDNRTPDEIKRWKAFIPGHIITEASGGISLEDLNSFGKTGVDFISLGMLTHSATSLDISLNITGGVKDELTESLQAEIQHS